MSERRRGVRGVVLRVLVALAACVLAPVACLYAVQDRFVYAPDNAVPPVGSVVAGGEEVTYPAEDGTLDRGWFAPARGTPTGITAVVFHGYNGNRSAMANDANRLTEHGIAVLLAEYRGYGGADGQPSEDGLRQDALAAGDYVRRRPGVDASRVVYIGYSLGTGVAVEAAQTSPPAALVLMAPYTSLPDVAWTRLPGLPYRLLMRTHFDSISRIADVRVPLLVIRGSDDHTIPPEQSQEVFDAANQPKQLVTLARADHDLQTATGPSSSDAITTFLRSAVPPR
jgi:fermentation-respiration switch protein FrsA (DUF1100 family)